MRYDNNTWSMYLINDSMANKQDKLHAEDFFYLNRDYANMQFSVEKVVKNLTAAILSTEL